MCEIHGTRAWRPKGHVFYTSRQTMIKTYYSTSIRKNMVQNCSYFKQIQSTTAIDDSNRRRNKVGLGCSREATAPPILIFKLLFRWLNIDRYFKRNYSLSQSQLTKTSQQKYYLVINNFRKISTEINNVDLHFYHYRRSFICREWFSAGTCILQRFPTPSFWEKRSNGIRK